EYFSRAEMARRGPGGHVIRDPTARGLHMKLRFTPNHTVDATSIVLVQTVTAMKNYAPISSTLRWRRAPLKTSALIRPEKAQAPNTRPTRHIREAVSGRRRYRRARASMDIVISLRLGT